MVYSTDHSKAVVPVLVLLFVALWFILQGDSVCLALLVFFSPFSIAIASLREERANLSAFRTFVRFVLVWFCLFPLPLGVWEGLRLVIVALPGLFSYLLFSYVAYVLASFVSHLCFCSCLGRAVLCVCGISWVSSLIFFQSSLYVHSWPKFPSFASQKIFYNFLEQMREIRK